MIIKPGDRYQATHTITDQEIRAFAQVSGDTNPIHLDDAYAAQTPFKKRIAHGMYLGGIISGILGTKFPGPGTLYLSQNFHFLRPAFVGETVTIQITAADVRLDKPIVRFEMKVLNQNGDTVLTGEAVTKVPHLDLQGIRAAIHQPEKVS
jgi:acyl dehydratase